MTQNSFNDGVDTTIHNTAMLLNTQLNQVIGDNPGMFNQKTLEKMLHYVIEPTFNQLNEMANNTNYNYNQFGGVVGQKQYNNILKKSEQKGGSPFYYNMNRVRSPMFMPRMRQTITPRVGYNPRLLMPRTITPRVGYNPRVLMPRTMIVPSYALITHERVKDLMDRRSRDKLNTYLSHHHSFEKDDSKTIKIRDLPPGSGISDHTKVKVIDRLGDHFYKITDENDANEKVVYGINLYYSDNKYRTDMLYPAYKQLLDFISARALYKSKHKASHLKYIKNNKIDSISRFDGKSCKDSGATGCAPILSISHGYFKIDGSDWNGHVMMLENVIE